MAFAAGLHHCPGFVARAIVDRHHFIAIARVIDIDQGIQGMGDDGRLVVGRHDHRHLGPVGGVDVEIGMTLTSEQPIEREQHMAGGVDDH